MQNNIQALLILDSHSGERILSKYFEGSGLVGDEDEQLTFEQNILQRICEVKRGNKITFEDLFCVHVTHANQLFVVVGKESEEGEDQQDFFAALLDYIVNTSTQALAIAPQLGLSMLSAYRDQQQRRRNKKRSNRTQPDLERRASKGRRIRYVEIPKLVNFFPATPESTPWSHEKRDELFKSLFA